MQREKFARNTIIIVSEIASFESERIIRATEHLIRGAWINRLRETFSYHVGLSNSWNPAMGQRTLPGLKRELAAGRFEALLPLIHLNKKIYILSPT